MRQEHVARQNRRRLLKQVRAMWTQGLLEHSLHRAALMALHVQDQPDALAHPWQFEVQETDQPLRSLPTGTSIVQVFDEAQGELLILGEAGAGKTTLLLELARILLEHAEKEERELLPVVFHLSSWAQKRQPLADWLVEELATTYQVPRKIGKAWIDANQILPLLDGLDEVAEEARPDCVQAINAYRERQRDKGAASLVVCCRSQDYAGLPTSVNLHQAVSIQPLTEEQIEEYVQSAKGQLEGLRQALHQERELSELAQRPLMLSIMTLAYQGAGPEELPKAGTREGQQQQVLASYVERMLSHQGISWHAPGEHMLEWLRSLSTQMQRHQQTVFFLEQMQPDWLADRRRRFLYQLSIGLVGWLLVGLLYGLLVGLLNGLLVGLVFGLIGGPGGGLVYGLLVGLGLGLLVGLLYGLVGRLLARRLGDQPAELSTNQLRLRPNQGTWRSARNGLVYGLVFGLLVGLTTGLVNGLQFGLDSGLINGLLVGLFLGLFGGLAGGLGAFLQHFALRFWLWRASALPWNVVGFLDEAAERLLLRKVGGGYIFIHRLFLDYFAAREKKEP